MTRYLCVHGHFYQPPRENPWLEAVELQPSAAPYHDWNERITAECYAPNAAARILGTDGKIARIVNNYASMSFNIGPTLLAWLERHAKDTYARILVADRESQKRFSGHGNAMAQVYNHMILPLANARDKHTQVRWGLTDFRRRFNREPEGMWLAEAAVDVATLEVLAEHGVRFTLLSPHSALRVRPLSSTPQDDDAWLDVRGGKIDPSRPYLCKLPSGRSISLFFYDAPISQAVAFERLLASGETFAARLQHGFSDSREGPQLVHIATDGESYGHHHRHGEMALAFALQLVDASLTNYGEMLARHPPVNEVQILETSAWSCAHGVDRWRADCGCNSGGNAGWNQAWRAPLRAAFDWLRDEAAVVFDAARDVLVDPWAARDAYIEVMLDRSEASVSRFLTEHARPGASRVRALELLELQRHAQLMYTSCGWFFDELSGIETVQVIQYAGRVAQLAERLGRAGVERGLIERLREAKPNVGEAKDGAELYERCVRPAMLDLHRVGAHFALSSVFERPSGEAAELYCYRVSGVDVHALQAGTARMIVGRADVASTITHEQTPVMFGAVHMGDQNLSGGVRPFTSEAAIATLQRELLEPFGRGDFAEVLRVIDRHFEGFELSLRSMFKDEQRSLLTRIMRARVERAEDACREIFERDSPLLAFHAWLGIEAPKAIVIAAEVALTAALRRVLMADPPDEERVRHLLQEAKRTRVSLDGERLGYEYGRTIERLARALSDEPASEERLTKLWNAVALVELLPFPVALHGAQNALHHLGSTARSAEAELRFRNLRRALSFEAAV